ncbi:hypothetical protein KY495_23310 [Massilia sp. PAMC28688]|uniref:hypothetical protein n=1 Tax=Massilia sp. PAMC28688 TaxID=2861283 RepID=UPI001C6289BF|nr:hypothetical protein [Massilia sp. PAMC28688]QYF93549.1 hypothetical protein KY495_23310 [Massilia sp. PAMC28688]
MLSITKPDDAALQDAIAHFHTDAGDKSAEALLAAGLVIVGEACSQLEEEGKSQEDVVASLSAQGLDPAIAGTWVAKAHEVINDTVNKDPERFLKERSGGISIGEILFYVGALALIVFIWQA